MALPVLLNGMDIGHDRIQVGAQELLLFHRMRRSPDESSQLLVVAFILRSNGRKAWCHDACILFGEGNWLRPCSLACHLMTSRAIFDGTFASQCDGPRFCVSHRNVQ